MMRCCICKKEVSDYLRDEKGNTYCSEDCFEKSLPKCWNCKKSMKQWIETSDGKKFCTEKCLESIMPKCASCGKPLKTWLESQDGKKYCNDSCFEKSLPKCKVCGKPVRKGITDLNGNIYCSENCFTSILPKCSVCGEPMREWLEDENGKFYCSENCFEKTLPKCKICGKPVRNGYVDESKNYYCSDSCYEQSLPKCAVCGKPVSQGLSDEKGNIFCSEECYEETLPKCTHCGKPLHKWIQTENNNFFCDENCLAEYMDKPNVFEMETELTPKEMAYVVGIPESDIEYFMKSNNVSGDDTLEIIDLFMQSLNHDISMPVQFINMIKNAGIYSKLASRLSDYNVMRGGTRGFGGFVFEELTAAEMSASSNLNVNVIANNGPADFIIFDKVTGKKVLAQAKKGYGTTKIDWEKYKGQTIIVDKNNKKLIMEAKAHGLDVIESPIYKLEADFVARLQQIEGKLFGTKNAPISSHLVSANHAGLASVKFAARVGVSIKLGETIYDVISGDKSFQEALPEFVKESASILGKAYVGGVAVEVSKDIIGMATKKIMQTVVGNAIKTVGASIAETSIGGAITTGVASISNGISYVYGAVASGPVGWVIGAGIAIGFGIKLIKNRI